LTAPFARRALRPDNEAMKTVLITGANRGLGLGFTRHYLAKGHRVFATARNPAACAEFATLRADFGERFHTLSLDLTSEASITALAAELAGIAPDIVLNNAGILFDEAFGEWTAEAFTQSMATNVTGPALVAQAVAPRMKEGSKLVNISSGLGSCGLNINPETGLDAYAASKAALNMITCRLAAKLQPYGIIVVACDPGWVRTRMGGENADLTVAESVAAITATIDDLTPDDTGSFLSRQGKAIPW
jgi:NAD(P)-dependent dehydrogenase (short-subunit alcohol dehydrogenase family)